MEFKDSLPPYRWRRRARPSYLSKCFASQFSQKLGRRNQKNNWGAPIKKVELGRKAGSYSFTIEVKWEKRFISIYLDEDTERWPVISQALPKVMKDLPSGNEIVEIDATYGNKIVVKTL